MKRTIVVGTRQSALALTQTGWVVDRLRELSARLGMEVDFELKKIVTRGDQILDVTLSKVGGKGLFTKELEEGMLGGEIDIAVHSMKDMPFELPEGLTIGAVPEREDPRDALISRKAGTLEELPRGARVGTSSLRRASQLQHARPDLRIDTIRGNIDSRLRKLESEGYDAILLAAAGLRRMGWEDRITALLPPETCVPAVGQGALAIECRADDAPLLELLRSFQHEPTALAVRAERSFLGSLNGGCQVPIGAYAVARPGESGAEGAPLLTMTGFVGTPDGQTLLKETSTGTDPEQLGRQIAAVLKERGADRILAAVRV
ncbi:hydroxymethylbilane synthase [Paenibacillus chartarius]|uniref:Porphobilinogen deaminase n=1 Tax=Paenibacillus chartarius TaxID=747481 RepID=A0ABV6DJ10_9BACL